MSALHLATLPPNVAFLDALAGWWLDRAAAIGQSTGDGLFLVPTRRAARGLAEAFLHQAGARALLLPRIAPFSGLDEVPLALAGALDLPPAVQPMRRLAVLTRLILRLSGGYGAPVTADRAWLLAVDLAALLDEAARAEIDLATALPDAAAQEFADHWNVTLAFLRIVTRAWPDWLAEEGLSDPVARQIGLLDAQGCAWADTPPSHAVIAAGTTGAIPAVARLLRVVAALPSGQVVLPGLDLDLDEESWTALDDTHPQASLRTLLASLGAERGDVEAWPGGREIAPTARVDALRVALLPASSLGQWRMVAPGPPPPGLMRLEAADEQEEAEAIALVLRQALEQQGARAALVTPDRRLAQRVAATLLHYGVTADDSAGEALAETPAAVFLRLLAVAFVAQYRPVALLSVLKHPYCAIGLAPAQCRAQARALERACLRGPAPLPGLKGLRDTPPGKPWSGKDAFLDRLETCLAPLDACGGEPATPDTQLRALIAAAEALSGTDTRAGEDILWQGEDGEALADHLSALLEAWAELPSQDAVPLPGLLDAALAGVRLNSRRAVRGRDSSEHPRVFIWGLLEARLLAAETMVLGGLTEGVWPPAADPGPWMNRAMRRQASLPSPEAAVGLSAHDFVACACAAEHVILSAPRRRDRAPCVPSRWLARLDGLLAGSGSTLEAHRAPLWARLLDHPSGEAIPVLPPAPAPVVAARPRRLSVTEIETWLLDPYAIYAKHVLRARKLAPIEQSADAADYGRIVHAGLQRFHEIYGTAWPADAEAQLAACMDAALAEAAMRPALAAWWQPRLRRIAIWVAATEAQRRAEFRLALICSEREGTWRFEAPAGPFALTGRADRIERMVDGSIAILDYKTNAPPSQKAVEDGLAPQLPLEAAMVAAGAFGAELMGRAVDLTYWQISGGANPGRVHQLFRRDGQKVEDAADHAAAKLRALVAAFDQPGRAYLSQPHPGAAPRFTDYAHLSRVLEWGALDEDGDASGPL